MSLFAPAQESLPFPQRVVALGASPLNLPAKGILQEPEVPGRVWRLMEGALRLDEVDGEERRFAGVALPGDLVGAEFLALGGHAYRVQALVPSLLLPVQSSQGGPVPLESVVQSLVRIQQRTAALLALRSGSAEERVSRLILLLAGHDDDHLVLPVLRDMADITDLAMESVSRAMTRLRQAGALVERGRRHLFALRRSHLLMPAGAAA